VARSLLHPLRSASRAAPAKVRTLLLPSFAPGDGHPVAPGGTEEEPLAPVRGADARSAQIGGPDDISQVFQVSAYRGEPRPAIRARNLLSKQDWREALTDESSPLWPKVPDIVAPSPGSRDAEGLAGARARPDGRAVGDTREPKSEGPRAEAGEGVELCGAPGDVRREVSDVNFMYFTFRYVPR